MLGINNQAYRINTYAHDILDGLRGHRLFHDSLPHSDNIQPMKSLQTDETKSVRN